MKKIFLLISIASFTTFHVNAQSSTPPSTGYAMPTDATDVSNIPPLVIKDNSVFIQEGGTIPSNPKCTCQGGGYGTSTGTAGCTFTHYFEGGKETYKQLLEAYKYTGGFANEIKPDYDRIGKETNGAFIKKSEFMPDGANAYYYTVTSACIEEKNPSSTTLYYFVRVQDDSNYGTIQIILNDDNPAKAKEYADGIISKLKSLDYATMK